MTERAWSEVAGAGTIAGRVRSEAAGTGDV